MLRFVKRRAFQYWAGEMQKSHAEKLSGALSVQPGVGVAAAFCAVC
jgi:hypothetical protein